MISTLDEYLGALFKINDSGNIPNLAVLLPRSEYIYNIDLDSRVIEAPEFLSVLDDHLSETVYFLVDRFFDNIDLSSCGCVIQYINASGDNRLYQVPYYDIETYHSIDKMLIPWCIEGEATKTAGTITFSIRFFQVDENQNILFNLNTLPATSKIKTGLKVVDTYITVDSLTEAEFSKGDKTYFIKENGEYKEATIYSPNARYYIYVSNDLNYPASYLDTLIARISNLERDTQAYWYNATSPSKMDG